MDMDNTIARLENIAKHAVHTAGEDTFILNLDDGLAIHEAIEALKAQLTHEGTTSDLISRRAAIDALDFEIVHMTAYCDGKNEGNPLAQYNKGLEDGKKAIEALPSAQPEIVRCKDCIYYNCDCVDAPYGLTHAIYWCDLHYDAVYDNLAVNPDDFCSRAERRTDDKK